MLVSYVLLLAAKFGCRHKRKEPRWAQEVASATLPANPKVPNSREAQL